MKFRLACIISFDDSKKIRLKRSFTDLDKFYEFLESIAKRNEYPIIYFHNLAFDAKYLMDFFSKHFHSAPFIETSGKIYSIKCMKHVAKMRKDKKGRRRKIIERQTWLEFRDSLPLLLTKLEKLGKMIDLPKLKFIRDEKNMESLKIYCFRDCEIIFHALYKFLENINNLFNLEWNFKNLTYSIGSFSKKVFQLTYPQIFYQHDEVMESELRKYYYGGRTEVFDFNLIEKVAGIDVNSQYPFVLSHYNFAHGKPYYFYQEFSDVNLLYEFLIKKKNVLGFTALITEKQDIPIFPRRYHKKTMFLNGKKVSFISRSEFLWLYRNGYFRNGKLTLNLTVKFFACRKVGNFSKFFIPLYKLRKSFKKESFFPYILKISMNSVYGKFGQRPERQKRELLFEITDKKQWIDDALAGRLYETKEGEWFKISTYLQKYQTVNILNAVLTTNYARFHLWKMLEFARQIDIKTIYTDTDSMVIEVKDIKHIQSLISKSKLGLWKIEYFASGFQAIDSKEYFFYTATTIESQYFKSKLKGATRTSIKSPRDIFDYYHGGILNQRIETPINTVHRGLPHDIVSIYRRKKSHYYDKRFILPDLTTRPIDRNINFQFVENMNRMRISKIVKKIGLAPVI